MRYQKKKEDNIHRISRVDLRDLSYPSPPSVRKKSCPTLLVNGSVPVQKGCFVLIASRTAERSGMTVDIFARWRLKWWRLEGCTMSTEAYSKGL